MNFLKRKSVRITLIALAVIFVSGHLTARYCAWRFGRRLMDKFMLMGRAGAEDTDMARQVLNGPEFSGYENWTKRLSFFGGHYAARIDELKDGFIYYCSQLGLPEDKRFVTPPNFRYLMLDIHDPTDKGIGSGVTRMLLDYQAHL